MKRKVLALSFMILSGVLGFAQLQPSSIFEKFEGNSSEKVYVSRNTSLLFTGEYLYYTVFCINDKTKQPSKISSLAYVVLVSEGGEIIFEHKVALRDSRGYGDFFIPTAVASGNYKLIAYTQWMRNGKRELFFEDDVSIVNPYKNRQRNIVYKDTLNAYTPTPAYYASQEKDKRFVLETDSTTYSRRSKVSLDIKNFRGAEAYGYYTLSVRKKTEFQSNVLNHTPISYLKWHSDLVKSALPKYSTIEYLPEELGERIIGRVISKDPNLSMAQRKVALSIPGSDFQLLAAITDESGHFYVDVLKSYTKPIVIAQFLDVVNGELEIELVRAPAIPHENLRYQKFYVNSEMKEIIEERSIYNQIENAYYEVKPDTLKLEDVNDPFLNSTVEEYDLEEYTRFPTLIETMVEILPYASIKKNGKSGFEFYVRLFEDQEGDQQSALVFIDGVLIVDYNEIVEFDATQIKKVSLIRDKFEIAGNYYRGMINIQTIDENYYETTTINNNVKDELIPIEPRKNYFNQEYASEVKEGNQRIPDYRRQLLWHPDIYFTGRLKQFEYYTSDVPGTYEIILEGFSIYGRPVFIKETITVK